MGWWLLLFLCHAAFSLEVLVVEQQSPSRKPVHVHACGGVDIIWSATVGVPGGSRFPVDAGSARGPVEVVTDPAGSKITTWRNVEFGGASRLHVSLTENTTSVAGASAAKAFALSFEPVQPQGAYVWEWNLSTSAIRGTRSLLYPSGYGRLADCASGAACDISLPYPGPAAFQLASAIGRQRAVSLATFDPRGSTKTIAAVRHGSSAVSMSVRVLVPGAGEALTQVWHVEYATVVACSKAQNELDWFPAAEAYRSWALSEAVWMKERPQKATDFGNVHFWMNSHWQEVDIFNITGGDPRGPMPKLARRLRDRLRVWGNASALHWYEWDLLGYEDSGYKRCPGPGRCGFDTHYPHYLPTRSGFREQTHALQQAGIRVVPYTNARIFDTHLDEWRRWRGSEAAALTEDQKPYLEDYGSGTKFAPMCPFTALWQRVQQDVAVHINEYGVDALYMDQIAAAAPAPCFNKSHGHPVGGGHHWVDGYRKLLRGIQAPVLSESNAEPYIGVVDAFLTLVAFDEGPNLTRPVAWYPAVYGGHYAAAGAIYHKAEVHSSSFTRQAARQWLLGSAIGWFSLIGRSDVGGAMDTASGILEDPALAEYINRLITSRYCVSNVFKHGRALRDLPATSRAGGASQADVGQLWLFSDTLYVLTTNWHRKETGDSFWISPADHVAWRSQAPHQMEELTVKERKKEDGSPAEPECTWHPTAALADQTLQTVHLRPVPALSTMVYRIRPGGPEDAAPKSPTLPAPLQV